MINLINSLEFPIHIMQVDDNTFVVEINVRISSDVWFCCPNCNSKYTGSYTTSQSITECNTLPEFRPKVVFGHTFTLVPLEEEDFEEEE